MVLKRSPWSTEQKVECTDILFIYEMAKSIAMFKLSSWFAQLG